MEPANVGHSHSHQSATSRVVSERDPPGSFFFLQRATDMDKADFGAAVRGIGPLSCWSNVYS